MIFILTHNEKTISCTSRSKVMKITSSETSNNRWTRRSRRRERRRRLIQEQEFGPHVRDQDLRGIIMFAGTESRDWSRGWNRGMDDLGEKLNYTSRRLHSLSAAFYARPPLVCDVHPLPHSIGIRCSSREPLSNPSHLLPDLRISCRNHPLPAIAVELQEGLTAIPVPITVSLRQVLHANAAPRPALTSIPLNAGHRFLRPSFTAWK